MDNSDILEQIANSPDLLAELTRDERFAETINAAANESVIKARDKALREKNNWKERAEALTQPITPDEPPSEPVVAPVSRSNNSANPELLKRIKDMEDQLNMAKSNEIATKKQVELQNALSGLPLKDGGMGVASKLINTDLFDVHGDGSIRHNETGMRLSEYVKDEWSQSSEAQLVLDTSANRGAGASQGRRGPNNPLGKRFSEASFDEKNKFYLENKQEAYEEWKARG